MYTFLSKSSRRAMPLVFSGYRSKIAQTKWTVWHEWDSPRQEEVEVAREHLDYPPHRFSAQSHHLDR